MQNNYNNCFIPIGIVALATGFHFINMRSKKEAEHINPTINTAMKKVYDAFVVQLFFFKYTLKIKKMAAIDGKQTVNMLYHAGVDNKNKTDPSSSKCHN